MSKRVLTYFIGVIVMSGVAVLSYRSGYREVVQDANNDPAAYGYIAESPGEDWLTYHGSYGAQRNSPLTQINEANLASVGPLWTYHVEGALNLRATPLVHHGRMYFVSNNDAYALDAATGKPVWIWRDLEHSGETTLNRGMAILNQRLFFATGDCRLVALDLDGRLLWSKKYVPADQGYYCTVAPLALKDRIVTGVSGGGRTGARGFVASFSPVDGKELWRFWTVPDRGKPGSETWGDADLEHSGASTWYTGSYDRELNQLYWPVGNPWPSFEGEKRPGDNLYSGSVVSLNPDTGALNWYFQFTPHDEHDWDAAVAPVLVDAQWQGKPRKLLMEANRNGFFYVLDRTNGKFLLGKPYAQKMNWASGLDANGRPERLSTKQDPRGTCPSPGATNWMSPTYNADAGLFYVVTLEQCDSARGHYYLRAIDPWFGKVAWEYPMQGPANMAAGALSTAAHLVIFGSDSGDLVALNAKNGKELWHAPSGGSIFASPMTYAVNGKQFIAIAAGSNILSFGLREPQGPTVSDKK